MCPRGENHRISRLAPSPTGALHLGNARTFLINWALARRHGWDLVLRIEDLDTPRTKRGADRQAIEDLQWLGLDWDGAPLYQHADLSAYRDAMRRLHAAHLIYPCTCTRKQIEAALSAPHADEHELRYPGTCRPREGEAVVPAPELADRETDHAWRVRVPDVSVDFQDELLGTQSINVQRQVGDFIVAAKAGLPAYQLAVVVDDARQGVTDVVRGDDLLSASARQILLYRMLNLGEPPRHWHVPLVLGRDGRRLAKRHGDTRLAHYRESGVPVERVIGLLARWCGVSAAREPMTAGAFAESFDIRRLPRATVTFTEDDERWLLQG